MGDNIGEGYDEVTLLGILSIAGELAWQSSVAANRGWTKSDGSLLSL